MQDNIIRLISKRKKLLWGGWIAILCLFIKPNDATVFLSMAGIVLLVMARKTKKQIAIAKKQAYISGLREEAEGFLKNIETVSFNAIPKNIALKQKEVCLLSNYVYMSEVSTERTRTAVGTRVKVGGVPIYLGESKSQSVQKYKDVSFGELILTSRRLVFSGEFRNFDIPLFNISSFENLGVGNGIRIAMTRKSKPIILGVENSFMWEAALKFMITADNATEWIENNYKLIE